MATTGQGFLGCNMFAYCLNNPIIMGDDEGMDAIVLVDNDGAYGCGHVGFLAQDSEGVWWHFYWGAKIPLLSIYGYYVKNAATYQQYSGLIDLDSINDSGVYSQIDTYDQMFRLSGDYSDAVNNAKQYSKNDYNLYLRNCSEVTFSLLGKRSGPDQKTLKTASWIIIPNWAYNYSVGKTSQPASSRRNAKNKCGGNRNLLY